MARIERFTSTEPLVVPQAQLVDPSAFRFSTASAEALGEIGGGLTELGKRELDAQDSLAINAAGESRDLAKLQMKQFMLNNPDPATWDEGLSKILSEQGKIYVSQKLSAKAKADEDIEQQAFADELLAETQIASVLRTVENDIFVSGKNLVDKIANDDGTPEAAANIAKQIDLYQAALERDDTKEIADIKMEETLREAKKAFYINQSKLFPEATIKEMQAKKKALGKGGVGEDGLSAKDYDAVIGSAITAQNQADKANDEVDREAKLALYSKEDEGEDLAREDFNNAWRSPEEADQHYDEYVTGQLAEQKGEVNFIKKGDPIVIARTEAIIDLNPMAITEEQLYENSTRGMGTENITSMVDRLRKAKEGFYAPITKYNTQFSTLLNAKYFGEKDEADTSTRYLELKRKMKEFVDSQKPTEQVADAFFAGLITKDFAVRGWFTAAGGGWEEKGFKHTFVDALGNEVTQRFRFGDIRVRQVGEKTISEFYAGTDDKGDALWLPRR